MAGLLTLAQPVEVRILCPQPNKIARFTGDFVFYANIGTACFRKVRLALYGLAAGHAISVQRKPLLQGIEVIGVGLCAELGDGQIVFDIENGFAGLDEGQ